MKVVNNNLIVLLFDLCWKIFCTVLCVKTYENSAFAFKYDVNTVVDLVLDDNLVAFGVLFNYVECL